MSCACGERCECREQNTRLARAVELLIEADDLRREADRTREQALLAARSAMHITGAGNDASR